MNDEAMARNAALFRIRSTLGWSASKAAELLGVTPRTIGLWETGAQALPDHRWRLFQHEVASELTSTSTPRVVVIFASDAATPSVPIDAVSDRNFVSLVVSDDGQSALISSCAIERLTGKPYVHHQRFKVAGNEHVQRHVARWRRSGLFDDAIDSSALVMNGWLTRRALDAERANPQVRVLKDNLRAAQRETEYAETEEELRRALAKQEESVEALVTECMKARR